MIDVPEILATLAQQRPIFHSEADFQHAFAWELHQRLPGAAIRLELPIAHQGKLLHVDIWAHHGKNKLAIELKYKTRALALTYAAEQYKLLDHSAQDCGRYDFLKDIWRLEQFTSTDHNVVGYAILLTNDQNYWLPPKTVSTVDAPFRLHDERCLQGLLAWGVGASSGTTKGREAPIDLKGLHKLYWSDYSQVPAQKAGMFRYLSIRVTCQE